MGSGEKEAQTMNNREVFTDQKIISEPFSLILDSLCAQTSRDLRGERNSKRLIEVKKIKRN